MTGKTSIAYRLVSGYPYQKHMPTIGVEYHSATLESNDQSIEIDLWDTSGQYRYRSIGKMHYRDADAIILVYDMSEDDSAEKLLNLWLRDITYNVNLKDVLILLLGNKADIADKSNTYVGRRAKELSASCFEVSAKTGQGFTEFKSHLVRYLFLKRVVPYPVMEHRESVILRQNSQKEKPIQNQCTC